MSTRLKNIKPRAYCLNYIEYTQHKSISQKKLPNVIVGEA
jgi:hypothetical protein